MEREVKKWKVEYSHDDGRSGVVEATTQVGKSGAFEYGNQKAGTLKVDGDGYAQYYDLRYSTEKDLHKAMLKNYFGNGLVKATEI